MPLPGPPSALRSGRVMTSGRPSTSYAGAPAWPALAPPASPARVRRATISSPCHQAQLPPECTALSAAPAVTRSFSRSATITRCWQTCGGCCNLPSSCLIWCCPVHAGLVVRTLEHGWLAGTDLAACAISAACTPHDSSHCEGRPHGNHIDKAAGPATAALEQPGAAARGPAGRCAGRGAARLRRGARARAGRGGCGAEEEVCGVSAGASQDQEDRRCVQCLHTATKLRPGAAARFSMRSMTP